MAALKQFPVNDRAGANDLGTTRTDAWDFDSLLERQLCDQLYNSAHHVARDLGAWPLLSHSRQVRGDAGQGGRRPRGCDHATDSRGPDAILDASHFSRYESA